MVGLTVIVVKEQYQDSKRKKKSKALLAKGQNAFKWLLHSEMPENIDITC